MKKTKDTKGTKDAMPLSENPILLIQWEDKAGNDELKRIKQLIMDEAAKDPDLAASVPDCTAIAITEASERKFKSALVNALKSHHNVQAIYLSGHHSIAGLSPSRELKVAVDYSEIGRIIADNMKHGHGRVEFVYGSCSALAAKAGEGKERFLKMPIDVVWGFTDRPTGEEVSKLMVEVLRHNVHCMKVASEASVAYAKAATERGLENVKLKDYFDPVADECVASAKAVIAKLGFKAGRLVGSVRDDRTGKWTRLEE